MASCGWLCRLRNFPRIIENRWIESCKSKSSSSTASFSPVREFHPRKRCHYLINSNVMTKRYFLGIPDPLKSSRRKEYSERRLIGYSMEDIYSVVADVEDYKHFVPWCRQSVIISRTAGHCKAKLVVGFPPVLEKYTSSVKLVPPNLVKAECTDGQIFNYMLTEWRFSPGLTENPNTCTLDFHVSFEFRSIVHSKLATMFFDEVVKKMVRAFEKRCYYLYGPNNLRMALSKTRSAPAGTR